MQWNGDPRPGVAGKRGRDEELEAAQKRVRVTTYTSADTRRPTTNLYKLVTEAQILVDFPMFYKKDLEMFVWNNNWLYAPTFIKLYQAVMEGTQIPGLRRLVQKRSVRHFQRGSEPEFDEEYHWVHQVWKVDYNARHKQEKGKNILARIPKANVNPVAYAPPAQPRGVGVAGIGANLGANPPAALQPPAMGALHLARGAANPAAQAPVVQPARVAANVRLPAVDALAAVQVPAGLLAEAARVLVNARIPAAPVMATPVPTARVLVQIPKPPVPAEKSSKIECACCFNDECSFDDMIQCPDAHLFCSDCVRAQAGVAVGARQRDILCMDTSGCKQPFPASELRRCLDTRTYDLWQRITQADDIAAANLEGLEQCPACDFAMIFEVGVDVAPVLTCLQSTCGMVSCRRCKKKAHEGRPCQDIEDANLRREHLVEEAMTKSMVRECPGCKIPFIKSDGCNKIICQNLRCRKVSCYLCRQIIVLENSYDHFDRAINPTSGKCALWDGLKGTGTERRHEEEVAAAQQRERLRLAISA